jgi:anthranilate synthase component I
VSGAPKVRAMELIGELEGEKRGVYAGAVGRWGFDQESMDTCLALRTMTFKDGVAYLQAGTFVPVLCFGGIWLTVGGGIVYDSDPYEEYIETLNKLKSNITTIQKAEELYARMQADGKRDQDVLVNGEEQQDVPDARIGTGL